MTQLSTIGRAQEVALEVGQRQLQRQLLEGVAPPALGVGFVGMRHVYLYIWMSGHVWISGYVRKCLDISGQSRHVWVNTSGEQVFTLCKHLANVVFTQVC